MSAVVSVSDILLGRVTTRLDEVAPAVGSAAVLDTLGLLVQERLATAVPDQGRAYVERLLALLDTPLPRILVAGWRRYAEFLPFADAAEGSDGRSGAVTLLDHEMESQWELAPRLHGRTLAGPRLLVGLTLGFDAGTVEVRDARFVALETAALRYRGSLRVKDAPEELAGVGPGRLEVPGGRFDFGDGWAIAPWRSTARAPRLA